MSDMVPDEVEAAERPRRLLDNAPRLLLLRQIGRECERATSSAGDFGHHRLGSGPVDVDDANRCTLLREAQGTRAAHAGGCGCHDADLVLQAHLCGPPRSWVPPRSPCRAARPWMLAPPAGLLARSGGPGLGGPAAELGAGHGSLRSPPRGCNRQADGVEQRPSCAKPRPPASVRQIPGQSWNGPIPLLSDHGQFEWGSPMPRPHRLLAPIVAYLLLVVPAAAEKRVALVVGNSAYAHANALQNPVNDAGDMAKALAEVGFDVILGLDLGKQAFDGKVRDFARALEKADVALDRKSTRLNSSHVAISYAVFCLKKKKKNYNTFFLLIKKKKKK